MMHQLITDPEQVADAINNIEGNIYQIIPFRRYNADLFLILYEDSPSTNSATYDEKGEPKPEEN